MRPALRIGALAAFQVAMVLGLVAWQERGLAGAPRLVLPVEPVDPRSLFQGDYVVLSYPISRLRLDDLALDPALGRPWAGMVLYVEVAARGATAVALHADRAPVGDGSVLVRGTVTDHACDEASGCHVDVVYGIEAYYVPEGEGRRLERERDQRRLSAEIAVHPHTGQARLTRLLRDGRPFDPGE